MQPLYNIAGKSLVLVSTCGSRFLRSLTKRSQSSLRYTHSSHNNKMAGGDEINVAALATPKPRVAVVQMNSTKDKERNYGICKGLIEKAKACGADMVFLPECFDFVGGSKERSLALAETLDGDIISRYKDIACKQKVWLSLGGFHEKVTKNFFDVAKTSLNLISTFTNIIWDLTFRIQSCLLVIQSDCYFSFCKLTFYLFKKK